MRLGSWETKKLWVSALLIILSASSSTYLGHWLPPVPSVNAQAAPQPQAKVAVTTPPPWYPASNRSDLTLTSGTVVFVVNVTNAPGINSFSVSLAYNFSILRAVSGGIDDTGNVLELTGQPPFPVVECIDGVLIKGGVAGGCTKVDGPGVVTLALAVLGNFATPSPTSGLLFQVSFNIVGVGLSQLRLLQVVLGTGEVGVETPVSTFDGYFTNIDCPGGSGILCTPPLADFTVSPGKLFIGTPVAFNASTSNSTNRGPPPANITKYNWSWGDRTTGQTSPIPTISHIYDNTGNYSVTLTVRDTYGISGSKTKTISVLNIFIDLNIGQITLDKQFRVIPGTPVPIKASVINNSTNPEVANLTLAVAGRHLGSQVFHLGPFRQQDTLAVTWDTTGYTPKVYRVDATVAIIPSTTSENITSNNIKSAYVQLADPLPSGIVQLSLLSTTGLGIILLAGVGFAVSRIRRKPGFETEPL